MQKSMGMTIVVTDHHEVPYTEIGAGRRYILPEADAVVDPKQEDCTYAFKGLCGAAVAYKLVEALMEAMGKRCGRCRLSDGKCGNRNDR